VRNWIQKIDLSFTKPISLYWTECPLSISWDQFKTIYDSEKNLHPPKIFETKGANETLFIETKARLLRFKLTPVDLNIDVSFLEFIARNNDAVSAQKMMVTKGCEQWNIQFRAWLLACFPPIVNPHGHSFLQFTPQPTDEGKSLLWALCELCEDNLVLTGPEKILKHCKRKHHQQKINEIFGGVIEIGKKEIVPISVGFVKCQMYKPPNMHLIYDTQLFNMKPKTLWNAIRNKDTLMDVVNVNCMHNECLSFETWSISHADELSQFETYSQTLFRVQVCQTMHGKGIRSLIPECLNHLPSESDALPYDTAKLPAFVCSNCYSHRHRINNLLERRTRLRPSVGTRGYKIGYFNHSEIAKAYSTNKKKLNQISMKNEQLKNKLIAARDWNPQDWTNLLQSRFK